MAIDTVTGRGYFLEADAEGIFVTLIDKGRPVGGRFVLDGESVVEQAIDVANNVCMLWVQGTALSDALAYE